MSTPLQDGGSVLATTRPTSPLALVRADLHDFIGYRSARSESFQGQVWLNANESPWPNPADGSGIARRYPEPQPPALRKALATLYGCQPEQLLAGRGSDEGIDLLVRALCRPGSDAVVVTPPTFGMYAVSARLHGTPVVEVPLIEDADGFVCDFDRVAATAETRGARLVFLCSPGNPSGSLLPLDAIGVLARRLEGRVVVVVDEAYLEYAQGPSAVSLLAANRNIVVLRTLSKAHALAAARIGSVIADAELIAVLRRCQAPYPLPAPCVALACLALMPAALALTGIRITAVQHERRRLFDALQAATGARNPTVRKVYRSQANFLLVRFEQTQAVFDRLLAAGIVVRDLRAGPGLDDALRITIGSAEQNAQVIALLGTAGIGP